MVQGREWKLLCYSVFAQCFEYVTQLQIESKSVKQDNIQPIDKDQTQVKQLKNTDSSTSQSTDINEKFIKQEPAPHLPTSKSEIQKKNTLLNKENEGFQQETEKLTGDKKYLQKQTDVLLGEMSNPRLDNERLTFVVQQKELHEKEIRNGCNENIEDRDKIITNIQDRIQSYLYDVEGDWHVVGKRGNRNTIEIDKSEDVDSKHHQWSQYDQDQGQNHGVSQGEKDTSQHYRENQRDQDRNQHHIMNQGEHDISQHHVISAGRQGMSLHLRIRMNGTWVNTRE